ncbi:MAG: transcriptional regulator [Alphaproteobacteria bacterium]|nr:transcriptional regulator [Alphaproteobacteria bacterium]
MPVRKIRSKRTRCPIASWLDVFGDKWTLVLVRDLMSGKRRYGEFLESPEGIPTNILADRLKKLEAQGIVTRERYSDRPPRYEYNLTRRGAELIPVLQAMSAWSGKHVLKPWELPEWFVKATPEMFVS